MLPVTSYCSPVTGTDDANAWWHFLKDKATVLDPIEDFEYGMREFAIRDCNGYIRTSARILNHENNYAFSIMKALFFYLICFIPVINAAGQKTEYFNFAFQPKDIRYSVFDKVEFADNRLNQDYIGIARKGNKFAPLWLHASLSDEIKILIDSAIKDVPKQPHTVLINFRNFFISENTGRVEFNVECYAKWDNEYWLIYKIDTSYKTTRSEMEKKVNETVNNFIAAIVHLDLSKTPKSKARSLDYISNIDINEKKELPVFIARKPERGVYYSYDEFKYNKPRLKVFNTVTTGRNELKKVLRLPVGNALAEKIPRDSLYAVSDGENIWIAAPREYARLNKRGFDFFFQATAYENNNIEEISLGFIFFGIPGVILTAIPRKALFEFRLNHINGKYILLRRAPDR